MARAKVEAWRPVKIFCSSPKGEIMMTHFKVAAREVIRSGHILDLFRQQSLLMIRWECTKRGIKDNS